SFEHDDIEHPCALIEWFDVEGTSPDEDTGFWVVKPEYTLDGSREVSVISLGSILRNAHLMPVFGHEFLPVDFHFSYTLDSFCSFFVNKYIDYHSNLIAF
ncbi:hypothetical protein BOTBODRAFT_90696, partial [Botryobasidium botryosum FD-172 SS1]